MKIEKPPIIILAGGFGTRLKEAVSNLPKVLAPIDEIPFLEYLLGNLSRQGAKKIIISTCYMSSLIKKYILDSEIATRLNINIKIVNEKTPLGTGGAVSYIVNKLKIKNNFFVINGDTWIKNFYNDFLDVEPPALGIVKAKNISRFGKVVLDKSENKIISFEEKVNDNSSGWISSGVLYSPPTLFQNWDLKPFSLEKKILPVIAKRRTLNALKLRTDFIDIGVPSDFYKFKEDMIWKIINEE